MREFAESEIELSEGPRKGKFRCRTQPFTGLWLDAVDSDRYCRFATTGPQQSGKTLVSSIIPTLYHLFEHRETVVYGVPNMDMAADKWREDLLPMIEQSRYRMYLPRRGDGSKGGKVKAIRFTNGATLRFMTGGAGDKARAGFTTRVLVITETDGMDESGGRSREADKVTQLEGRTRAFGRRKRIYMECTVTTDDGRTWREYKGGTASKIVMPCPHCHDWVSPDREHLRGWSDADEIADAMDESALVCPECGVKWEEEDRRAANLEARLLHRGQTIDERGIVHGDHPRTDTLGFRWNAVNNLFVPMQDVAAEEWRGARDPDPENAEKALRQFVWALPYQPRVTDLSGIDPATITRRLRTLRTGNQSEKGLLPPETQITTASIDLGKFLNHWVINTWMPGATPHVADYGRIEVPSNDLAFENAILASLREFREMCDAGWPVVGSDRRMAPAHVLVDAGDGAMQPTVLAFVAESNARPGARTMYHAAKGAGAGQFRTRSYTQPRSTGTTVLAIGEGYHIAKIKTSSGYARLLEFDSDHWKSWVHARLSTPIADPGALTLFLVEKPHEHLSFAQHMCAERREEEFKAGIGMVTRWRAVKPNNHFLDAESMASIAGHLAGVRLIRAAEYPSRRRRAPQSRPDAWKPTPLKAMT